MYNLIFDIDGTLLPLSQEAFTNEFVRLVSERLCPDPDCGPRIPEYIMRCAEAVVRNDGTMSNDDRFWTRMNDFLPGKTENIRKKFVDFYLTDFEKARSVVSEDGRILPFLERRKRAGDRLFVASSPIFPKFVQEIRLRWAGISPAMFEDITASENSTFSKPNPAYYTEICERHSLRPEDCVMVGNDADEDAPALDAGMRFFLLTDNLYNRSGREISNFSRGSWEDLERFLDG